MGLNELREGTSTVVVVVEVVDDLRFTIMQAVYNIVFLQSILRALTICICISCVV